MKFAVALLVLSSLFVFAQEKPQFEWPKIASIDGPCSQIVGRNCYNAYQTKGQSWFGVYSFDDKDHKVTLMEKFDCRHPNGRMKWGSAGSNPNATFPVYRSKKVKGLYSSCYGTDTENIQQHSTGDNSPNIVGNGNVTVVQIN